MLLDAVSTERSTLEALVAAERTRLEALAARLVWDRDEARDVVQAALERAVSRWSTVRAPGAAAAWLRTLVVNQAMSHLRRRKVMRAVGRVLFVSEELVPAADEGQERAEHLRRLGSALEALSSRQATAFSLRYLEGLSIDEVALAMGVDRGTVRVHLQRAVAALRKAGALGEPT